MVLSDDRRGDRGRRPAKREVFLYAFDLLELNGRDIRREPWSDRRWKLARLLRGAGHGVQLSDHMLFPFRPHVEQTATKIKQYSGVQRVGVAAKPANSTNRNLRCAINVLITRGSEENDQ